MTREIKLGNKLVGDGQPAYVIAEIGINHNGDLGIAKEMIKAAAHAGADAVKFQKRTPEVCTPPEQQKQMRETPWGYIPILITGTRSSLGWSSTAKSTMLAVNWASTGLYRSGMSSRWISWNSSIPRLTKSPRLR